MAQFDNPISLAVTADGGLLVGELTHSTLRSIYPTQRLVQAATGLTGTAGLAAQLPVSGLTGAAIYYFRAIAANGGGTTVGNPVSTGTPYQTWQLVMFGADAGNPLIAGASVSPVKDGVSNLLKYALGLDPAAIASGGLPVMGLGGGALSLTYTKAIAATDVTYTVEWSADLVTWSPAGVTEQVLTDNGSIRQIRASVPIGSAKAKFIRLHVSL